MHFLQSNFFSSDLFRLWSLGYHGVMGWVCGAILVLRTFPELALRLVWRFACGRGTQMQSVCFIHIDKSFFTLLMELQIYLDTVKRL